VEPRRPGWLEQLLALASSLIMVWVILPEHQRKAIMMRFASSVRHALARFAVAEGRAGMADELAGRDPMPRYGAALALSRCRDRLSAALTRMGP
jgi:hypothetical protein